MGLRAQLRAEDSRLFGARVADARLDGVMLRLRGGEGAAGIFAASVCAGNMMVTTLFIMLHMVAMFNFCAYT